ncbi:isoprenoid synthase domain-containing protein [Mycena epipterygia]|nr:isoprenoid synthase domain-containing protein [Mycena epipterygia]
MKREGGSGICSIDGLCSCTLLFLHTLLLHRFYINFSPTTSTTSSDYITCIQRLVTEIGHRYEPFPPYDANYWEPFHAWTLYTLGPMSSWSAHQLTEVEHAAGSVIERAYPFASTPLKLLFAKLTAMAFFIDDSIEDESMYAEFVQFSHKLFLGEVQQSGILALYHATLKELSTFYSNDAVRRDLAIVPWISYIDACLIEKDLFTEQKGLPPNCGYSFWLECPDYLRYKSGVSEAYGAWIFQAGEGQKILSTKYIGVLPDLIFFIESNAVNDLFSFHKEELAGETYTYIHLRTRSLSASGARGGGTIGEWMPNDTIRLLCDETAEAARRIDGLLRLEECERKIQGEAGLSEIDELDVEIAKQWRAFRNGYISWYVKCRRYKLYSMKSALLGGQLPGFIA